MYADLLKTGGVLMVNSVKDFSIRLGGMAGDGVSSLGEMISKASVRMGLYTATYNSYQSVIRGGHVWYQIKMGVEPLKSYGDSIDLLVCITNDTLTYHMPYLNKEGRVLIDPMRIDPNIKVDESRLVKVPFLDIATKYSKNPIVQNTVIFGCVSRITGISWEVVEGVIRDNFINKGDAITNENLKASKAGYDLILSYNIQPIFADNIPPKKIFLMTGNDAIALGAAAAGCKFLAQYPMTPATSILHWLSAHSNDLNIFVKQTEDEIAAINMAIGASYAGVRSMVATSGGGFSLMVEALGMAGMIEVPLVVVDSQRSGPSTGLPTKTEQADLNMLVGASQGEFPRIILAPGSVEEAFYLTQNAFNLADRYQVPVIIASDLSLSERYESVTNIKFDMKIDRGAIATEGEPDFKRYEYTANGISRRSFPGMVGTIHTASSDEHDEYGKLVSDVLAGTPYGVSKRIESMNKRMKKLENFKKIISYTPYSVKKDNNNLIISWGSTKGVVREAIELLSKANLFFDHLHMDVVWPINGGAVLELLKKYENVYMVEMNYTGQLAKLITSETGYVFNHLMLKYDGEPLYPVEVYKHIRKVIS